MIYKGVVFANFIVILMIAGIAKIGVNYPLSLVSLIIPLSLIIISFLLIKSGKYNSNRNYAACFITLFVVGIIFSAGLIVNTFVSM